MTSKKVRGSMETVPAIEVGKSRVRVRSNIVRIETEDFIGWEYDEVVYKKDEYIGLLTNEEDSGMMAMMISMLMGEIDTLNSRITTLEGGGQ